MNPPAFPSLSRREAIARLGLVLGGTLIGGDAWLRGAPLTNKTIGHDFSAADIALLDVIGDTIIPATDTPGAGAVQIGAFMVMMVNDCYDDAHHAAFAAGLQAVDAASRTRFGCDFRSANAAQRTALLNALDEEQKSHRGDKSPAHYFRMMKQLTLLGYFTSEIGATQALRFVEVPGHFDGDAAYRKGDRNWFSPPGRSV